MFKMYNYTFSQQILLTSLLLFLNLTAKVTRSRPAVPCTYNYKVKLYISKVKQSKRGRCVTVTMRRTRTTTIKRKKTKEQRTKKREREREREVYCLIQFCKNLIIQKNSDLRTTT